uniref:Uncharacterized protein n=1 Tax=Rhodnius prolixus TaxID=13249 RepID=T1HZ91_RHOPR
MEESSDGLPHDRGPPPIPYIQADKYTTNNSNTDSSNNSNSSPTENISVIPNAGKSNKRSLVREGTPLDLIRAPKLGKNDDMTKNSGHVAIETLQLPAGNKFKPNDKGPYFIFVEGNEGNLGSIHRVTFGKWIYTEDNKHSHDILDIRSVGKNE